jgi:formate C-acetyltransferase
MGSTVAEMTREERLWGTFSAVRDRLFGQFRDVSWTPDTGLGADELEREAEAYLQAHAGEPRVLLKANLYRLIVTRARISVDPRDWFADKLDHGGILHRLQRRWYDEAKGGPIKKEADWFARTFETGLARGLLDVGHISPGWQNMFDGGLAGLTERARAARRESGSRATDAQRAFWEAVEIVCAATIALAGRFAALARRLAEEEPAHAARLAAVAAACDRVPARAPETFHQALQFAWLMHQLIEMEGEHVRSMGHFDRTFYPYYRADIEAGRLTRAQAKELIQFAWIKHHARTQGRDNGKNFVFGGQLADGSDATNDLTWLALEAYAEMQTPDPKLSVRFHPGSPERLYRRVAGLIRDGLNSFVLMNDEPAVAGLVKRGKAPADARLYLPIGCYEPAVDGKEAGCTMNYVVNLAKPLELALHDGVDPLSGWPAGPRTGDPRSFRSFEDVWRAYAEQLDFVLERSAAYIAAHERQWPRVNPSPLIAATIDDCIARGRDIGEGGAHYNAVGCVGVGLANAADSLTALRRAVFEDGTCTMAGLVDAVDADFAGREPLRRHLREALPKYGNDNDEADAMARRVADRYCAKVHTFCNARGGPLQAALFTLTFQWEFGRATGATPDGRRAREPLAPGAGPQPGLDRSGVTALLNSASRLDYSETPNGAVVDVTLHPSAVAGENGLEAFAALIRTFFAQGGYALQCNVYDADTLRDAQRHPERHAGLQIRVTGWSVFFTKLSRFEQDQFIARVSHRR